MLSTSILYQNYLYHDNEYYEQTNDLAMGATTSASFADIFLHHIKHNLIVPILITYTVTYCRHINNILITYNSEKN
jgi:hypothetical protein